MFVSVIAELGFGFVEDFADLVEVLDPDVVICLALPKEVLRGVPYPMASRTRAGVVVDEHRRV